MTAFESVHVLDVVRAPTGRYGGRLEVGRRLLTERDRLCTPEIGSKAGRVFNTDDWHGNRTGGK